MCRVIGFQSKNKITSCPNSRFLPSLSVHVVILLLIITIWIISRNVRINCGMCIPSNKESVLGHPPCVAHVERPKDNVSQNTMYGLWGGCSSFLKILLFLSHHEVQQPAAAVMSRRIFLYPLFSPQRPHGLDRRRGAADT